jgi:hypothetical protein
MSRKQPALSHWWTHKTLHVDSKVSTTCPLHTLTPCLPLVSQSGTTPAAFVKCLLSSCAEPQKKEQ